MTYIVSTIIELGIIYSFGNITYNNYLIAIYIGNISTKHYKNVYLINIKILKINKLYFIHKYIIEFKYTYDFILFTTLQVYTIYI